MANCQWCGRGNLQSRKRYSPARMTRWNHSPSAGVKGVEPDGKVSLFQQEGGERGLVCEQVGGGLSHGSLGARGPTRHACRLCPCCWQFKYVTKHDSYHHHKYVAQHDPYHSSKSNAPAPPFLIPATPPYALPVPRASHLHHYHPPAASARGRSVGGAPAPGTHRPPRGRRVQRPTLRGGTLRCALLTALGGPVDIASHGDVLHHGRQGAHMVLPVDKTGVSTVSVSEARCSESSPTPLPRAPPGACAWRASCCDTGRRAPPRPGRRTSG